jgi:thiamine pyrophosphokinase
VVFLSFAEIPKGCKALAFSTSEWEQNISKKNDIMTDKTKASVHSPLIEPMASHAAYTISGLKWMLCQLNLSKQAYNTTQLELMTHVPHKING